MDEQKNQNPQPQPARDVATTNTPPSAVVSGGASENDAGPVKKPTKPEVTEHPIDIAEAKKFEGVGDFAMPVSPLSEAVKTEGKPVVGAATDVSVKPAVGTGAGIEKLQEKQAEFKPIPPPPAKLEDIQTQTIDMGPAGKAEEKKPAEAAVKQTIISGSTKDLEKKAKDLLKDLDKLAPRGAAAGGEKSKKKRSGGATKMALAAVLVVMMGAGAVVGVNLFQLNQSTETRSQADSCSGKSKTQCTGSCSWQENWKTYQCGASNCNETNGRRGTTSGCSYQPASCTGSSAACSQAGDQIECEQSPGANCTWLSARCVGSYRVDEGRCESTAPSCSEQGEDCGGTTSCCLGLSCVRGVCVTSSTVTKTGTGTGYTTDTLRYGCTFDGGATWYSSITVNGNTTSISNNCITGHGVKVRYLCKDRGSVAPSCTDVQDLVVQSGTTLCPDRPGEDWCGVVQVDFGQSINDTNGACFVSKLYDDCEGVTPTPTPTPSPEPIYSCTGLTKNVVTPKIGDSVRFTCSGSGADARGIWFRYRTMEAGSSSGASPWTQRAATALASSVGAGGNTLSGELSLTINVPGTYEVECRVCSVAENPQDSQCTAWGQANRY